MGFVYSIKNNITGKEYVGKTIKSVEERYSEHISNGRKILGTSKISESLRTYGTINHTVSVIDECDDSCLLEREQYWIDKLNTIYVGYNIKNEYLEKTESLYYGDEQKALENLGVGNPWNKNIPMSDETKRKVSDTLKKKYSLGLYDNYGHSHTNESKKKISMIRKQFFEDGGQNSNAKIYDVYIHGVLKFTNITKSDIIKVCGITYNQFKTIRKHNREHSENVEHPKFNILIKNKGKYYDKYYDGKDC